MHLFYSEDYMVSVNSYLYQVNASWLAIFLHGSWGLKMRMLLSFGCEMVDMLMSMFWIANWKLCCYQCFG